MYCQVEKHNLPLLICIGLASLLFPLFFVNASYSIGAYLAKKATEIFFLKDHLIQKDLILVFQFHDFH